MDWAQEEVKLIVEDYFVMLQQEINGQRYNKTAHRKGLLPLLNNRKGVAVEYKHRNISAALINMGLPFIEGYKPLFNYQKQLIEKAVAKCIKENFLNVEENFEIFSDKAIKTPRKFLYEDVLKTAPKFSESSKDAEPLFKPFKTNYLEREQNNRTLGEQGEKFVIDFERWRLMQKGKESLADKIEWVSKDRGDGLGYDILSKNSNGSDRYIEVKTTKLSEQTPIYVSKTEMKFASQRMKDFYLYRVFNFDTKPQLFIKNGVYEKFSKLVPQSYKAFFI